jgi:hypothetical protein
LHLPVGSAMSLSKTKAATGPSEAANDRELFVKGCQASGSSDGLWDGTKAGELRIPSAKYTCGQCGVDHYKSDVWIGLDDPSMDWQGSLNLWCRECWNEHEEDKHKKWALPAWRKACKQHG